MASRRRVLFLQLPQLDNDVDGSHENLPVAAACLQQAADADGESRYHEFLRLPLPLHDGATPCLIDAIADLRPDVIAATLYLWNIEWTLRVLKAVRGRLPRVNTVVGGPETACAHPFLFRGGMFDAVVVGEGENVFPEILRAYRTGRRPDYTNVAFRVGAGYRWGCSPAPPVDLSLGAAAHVARVCGPNAQGMAYLEASRGCPLHCTYCRYAHLRPGVSFLPVDAVEVLVRRLQRQGAREIRFIDPTFNAHPEFRAILQRLVRLNRPGALSFFAEVSADRLTDADMDLLAMARFVDLEVGMQSRDRRVLKTIRRPTDLVRLEAGIRGLVRRGIKVTLDVMYGLPFQTLGDVRTSIEWALGFREVNVQCLQTLLLPGTELRRRHREWRMRSSSLPPYGVAATSTMNRDDFRAVEHLLSGHPRLRSDVPTARFVGRRLPGLFPEAAEVTADQMRHLRSAPGRCNRRRVIIRGSDLFAYRAAIGRFMTRAIRQEPDTLFQFVLAVDHEEPLDLLDELIAVLQSRPRHLIDRYAATSTENKLASRRMLVELRGRNIFSPGWTEAVEQLLASAFF